MSRLTIFAMLTALPLAAATIDVSNQETAWVHTGAHVTVTFSVRSYAIHAARTSDSSAYPTGLDFVLITQVPDGAGTSLIPDTSVSRYAGCVFIAYLESLDGSISIPLRDTLAERVGLETGSLVLTPGTVSGGSVSELAVGTLYGSATLTEEQSAALFADTLTARIVAYNLGSGVWIGAGHGLSMRYSAGVAGVTGGGSWNVGGVTQSVVVSNPEPGTWLLGASALLLIWGESPLSPFRRRRR
jgi:hypothetical protein